MLVTRIVAVISAVVLTVGCATTAPQEGLRTLLLAYAHVPDATDIAAATDAGAESPIVIVAVKMLRVRTPLFANAFQALPSVDSILTLDAEANPMVELLLTTPDSVTAADLAAVAAHQANSPLDREYSPGVIIAAARLLSIDSIAAYPRFVKIAVVPVAGHLQ